MPATSLIINGQEQQVPSQENITGLLEFLGLAGRPVLVEHNGTALFARDFPSSLVADGDKIEIIQLAAGG